MLTAQEIKEDIAAHAAEVRALAATEKELLARMLGYARDEITINDRHGDIYDGFLDVDSHIQAGWVRFGPFEELILDILYESGAASGRPHRYNLEFERAFHERQRNDIVAVTVGRVIGSALGFIRHRLI